MTETPTGKPWLAITAAVALLMAVYVAVAGGDRSFWYDEVFTLGAAAVGRPLDWQVLLGDVHPPTYVLAVRALGAVTGGDSFWLRLVNLPGVLALALGLVVLAAHLDRRRTLLFAALILANGYALSHLVELRAYFAIFGLTVLAQALLVAEQVGRRPQTLWLALTVAALAALHFFGAAIGLTLLGLSTLGHWVGGRPGRAAVSAALTAAITAGTLYWAFGIANTAGSLGGEMWVTNDLGTFVNAASLLVPLAVLGILLLGVRAPVPRGAPRTALAACAIVLAVTLLISIHSPVVTTRNLIVLVPGLTLAAVMTVPDSLLDRLEATPLLLILVLSAGYGYVSQGTANFQMIRWAVTEATPAACDGAPLYVKVPDVVDRFAQEVFVGAARRPLRDFSAFEPPDLPPGCDVIATGWHELGDVAQVTAFLAERGLAAEAILPPDPALAAQRKMTHGFVVRLTSPGG